MKVIAGLSSLKLGERVSRELGCPLAGMECKIFPDGEQYCRVVEDVGEHVVIVHSTPGDNEFVSLLLLLDACEDAERVDLVIPYFGYSRQDKKFLDGEPISARAIARCLKADRTVLINLHASTVASYFSGRVDVLDAMPLLAEHVSDLGKDIVLMAPDMGAFEIVKNAAAQAGLEFDYLEKKRISDKEVQVTPKNLEVKGRDVVLLDDIIATGGSIATAAEMILGQGAKAVHAAAVHGVLSGNARQRMAAAGVGKLFLTDTLESADGDVSVAQLVADILKP